MLKREQDEKDGWARRFFRAAEGAEVLCAKPSESARYLQPQVLTTVC